MIYDEVGPIPVERPVKMTPKQRRRDLHKNNRNTRRLLDMIREVRTHG